MRRYCLVGTVSNPVRLVNPKVTELGAEVPPQGVNFNAPAYRSPVASRLALAESGQVQACSQRLHKPLAVARGYLTSWRSPLLTFAVVSSCSDASYKSRVRATDEQRVDRNYSGAPGD